MEGGRESPSPFFFPLAAGCPFPRTLPRMQNAKYSLPLFKIAIPPQLSQFSNNEVNLFGVMASISILKYVFHKQK